MILIVDDNQENIFSLGSLLRLHQFEVDSASSGEEALKKILQYSYALIILDVQMPDMDGFEVAEAISGYSKSKDIPIIFLSAVNTHKRFITKGYASGAIDYVTKPFDPDILLLKIKTFYRLSEQTRQLNELQRNLRVEIERRKKAETILEKKVDERTRELTRSNQQLEQSNQELQQFAYVASHDLQEPLRKIQTFANMAIDFHLEDKARVRVYLQKITDSARRLRELISDLLNFSRINIDAQFVKTDLNEIIRQTLADIELPEGADAPVIHVDKIPLIEAIPLQMWQVFQNLISNSIKFSRPGITARIDVQAELVKEKSINASPSSTGEYCRITIQDNGIGFSNDYRTKIFEIFQRLNARDEYKGTGIGLAIVKKVIDRHGGLITAHGKENQGAVFTIVLPVSHSNYSSSEKTT
jgi:signal transduction histidine kinase